MLTARSTGDQYAAATSKNNFDHEYSVDSIVVTLSIALAFYNSLEMSLLICSTFKKWKGLYFWSLSFCNTGVVLYTLGMLLTYFNLGPLLFAKVVLDIGWVLMLTCQSLVLYSRLNLIVNSLAILQAVKWMILVNSILLCTIVVTMDFGSVYSGMPSFSRGYYYIEKIQLTLFTTQELIISGIYVWKTLAMLRIISKENTRSMIFQLLIINVLIICMDVTLVSLQYLHYQLYQESIKAFVYSVKLKLEVNILSKLVNVVHGNTSSRAMTLEYIDSNAIAGQAQTEVEKEMHEKQFFGSPPGKDTEKRSIRDSEFGAFDSASSSNRNDDNDEISRVLSTQSTVTARTRGRESDILYADMLKSIQ